MLSKISRFKTNLDVSKQKFPFNFNPKDKQKKIHLKNEREKVGKQYGEERIRDGKD